MSAMTSPFHLTWRCLLVRSHNGGLGKFFGFNLVEDMARLENIYVVDADVDGSPANEALKGHAVIVKMPEAFKHLLICSYTFRISPPYFTDHRGKTSCRLHESNAISI